MKLKKAKVLPLEDIYVRASRIELKSYFHGALSSQMDFFAGDHCLNPKTTSLAVSAMPVESYAYMPAGQPKNGVLVFDTPQKRKQIVDTVVCHDEGKSTNSKTSFQFYKGYLSNSPALKVAWKGKFQIPNYFQELYLQAHPPGKVWRMAYLVSKQMPGLLHLTLQSRHDVWPDMFNIDPPSISDIALYFWADDLYSDTYNQLLKYMENKDLSLRSRLDNVELLVFTSKQLPAEYQRVNRQSYLWGVFQSLKGQQNSGGLLTMPHLGIGDDSMKVTNKDDDQALDMDIDMIGGKEVGRIDKCISKAARMHGSDMATLYMCSGFQSGQLAQECTLAKHQYQEKSEHCHGIGVSPVFSTSHMAPGSSDVARMSSVAGQTKKVKSEQCDDYEQPGFRKSVGAPGLSRLVTSGISDKGPSAESVAKMSPEACQVDAPPGFSKLLKLKEGDSSSKIKREQCDVISTPGFSRLVDSPVSLRSITTDATNEVSCTISPTKMTPVTCKVDAHPGFCKLLEKERNTSSKVKREHCDVVNPPEFSNSVSCPGLVRQVATAAIDKAPSTTSIAKMSPITCKVDAPPGFSKLLELKQRNTSSKVKREQCDNISSLGLFRLGNSPELLRPIARDATNNVPSNISHSKASPVTKLDVPYFSKAQELKERDISSKIPSHHVKKEPYADVDAPGFSRLLKTSGSLQPVISIGSDKGSIALTNMTTSPVACTEDAPPGFCKSIKPEAKIS